MRCFPIVFFSGFSLIVVLPAGLAGGVSAQLLCGDANCYSSVDVADDVYLPSTRLPVETHPALSMARRIVCRAELYLQDLTCIKQGRLEKPSL
jgi:hypothetical protein